MTKETAVTENNNPLVAFLLARIEEDEATAGFVRNDSPIEETRFCTWATPADQDRDRLVVAVDYQRVLAECVAKRRIIEAYLEVEHHDSPQYAAATDYMETVLLELASAHADHPDYLPQWEEER
ncbi:hypothetical protein GCM10011359_02570 [Nesterenkonia alkaliphila]|nr:DUF6221 family protein [Nesterenkonia alkaliphila]GFZ77952.1 hypothetical protein GCM10011359_02570 [Nesterenkonia alkaliphila]